MLHLPRKHFPYSSTNPNVPCPSSGTTIPFHLLGFFLFFPSVLGFELRVYTLSHSTNPFMDGLFQDKFSGTIAWAVFEPLS
jgi:hypothetical protein